MQDPGCDGTSGSLNRSGYFKFGMENMVGRESSWTTIRCWQKVEEFEEKMAGWACACAGEGVRASVGAESEWCCCGVVQRSDAAAMGRVK